MTRSLRNEMSFVLRLMEMRLRTRIDLGKKVGPGAKDTRLQVVRSVTPKDAKRARDELRILDLEREILSYAIRHLYQAEANGKINKNERDHLANSYKERIAQVKKTISRNESVVALHELEEIQADLVKLFNNHFGDLNIEIGKLRSRLKLKPLPSPPPKKKKRRKRSKTPKKNRAEEKIEKIRAEIDKTLQRLDQIEIET